VNEEESSSERAAIGEEQKGRRMATIFGTGQGDIHEKQQKLRERTMGQKKTRGSAKLNEGREDCGWGQ